MTPSGVCRACDLQETAIRFMVGEYPILACRHCRSLTTSARMQAREAQGFYDHEYFHGGDYRDYPATEKILKRNFIRLVQRLKDVQPNGALLEVGCAYGFFLDLARTQWQVTGVDISREAITSCEPRFPGTVFAGDIRDLDLPVESFDWVVAWDVVEHLDDPRRTIARIFELLMPGGRLALTTGDSSSLAARLMGRRWRLLTPPSHLTFFSRQGMHTMLTEIGFGTIHFATMGYHRSMDFAAFRLLGPARYSALARRLPALHSFLQLRSFYVDLGDIMFVIARKPPA